jgi:hypothetical protein
MAENLVFKERKQCFLKEKWFVCCLFDEQWNDSVFHGNAVGASDGRNKVDLPDGAE